MTLPPFKVRHSYSFSVCTQHFTSRPLPTPAPSNESWLEVVVSPQRDRAPKTWCSWVSTYSAWVLPLCSKFHVPSVQSTGVEKLPRPPDRFHCGPWQLFFPLERGDLMLLPGWESSRMFQSGEGGDITAVILRVPPPSSGWPRPFPERPSV